MKKYFFSKAKWAEDVGERLSKIFTWPNRVDGAEVFLSESIKEVGRIESPGGEDYLVLIEWCDEVEVDVPEDISTPSNECEYCNPKTTGPLTEHLAKDQHGQWLMVIAVDKHTFATVPVYHCPRCGRKLQDT